jgi:hypothetical protein
VTNVDGMLAKSPFAFKQFYIVPGNRVDLDLIIPADAAGKTFTVQDTFSRNNIDLAFSCSTSIFSASDHNGKCLA